MRRIAIVGLLLAGLGVATQAAMIQIGTGLDGSGNLLALGAAEQNYTVSGNASAANVRTSLPSNWLGNVSNGQWISPPNDPTGLTFYTRTLGPGTITGQFSSDNPGELLVNGVVVAQTSGWPGTDTSTYQSWWSFNANLTQAVNTIKFEVNNLGGPAGLIVAGTFTPVPEPSTVIAGALLLLPFGASALRVLRKKS
jgi:hypothetical protein